MAAEKTKAKVESSAALVQGPPPASVDNLAQLGDMDVEISVELGRQRLTLDSALDLGDQSLIELDKVVGEAVDIRLNGKLFAKGEVVTVSENFGVRLVEIIRD
ncbi:MAG: hypothetical protein HOK54_18745 [Alphaproteobacteria bacterium]|jgi:flagellar motor switch protein FliN|nr:hypothetical protein [Alphaproteobacteria bacterium]